jgi:hypothetical protein
MPGNIPAVLAWAGFFDFIFLGKMKNRENRGPGGKKC